MRRHLLNIARLLAILIVPLTIGLAASQASAVNVFPACNGSARDTEVCKNVNPGNPGKNPVIKIMRTAIIIITIIVGIAAVIMIIVAGLSFVTANGDPQAIARARGSIIYALVGVIIVVLAQTLVYFVLNKL